MTIKFALKAGCAALALAGMASANAGLFYVDIGQTFASGGVTSTSTAMKNELQYKYDSNTVILDSNGDGVMSAGDLLTTSIGLGVSGKTTSTSAVTNFIPIPDFSGNSNNGYGAPNWLLSFGATGLNGMVTGVNGGVPTFAYGPGGVLKLYVQTATSGGLVNFMNVDLTGGGATGVSTILNGVVDFTGISGAGLTFANMFHSGTSTCGLSSSFFDIWTNCGGSTGDMAIQFGSTQDTNVVASQFTTIPGGFDITSNHNGSATFDIPEPGSLALLGLALAGLGMTQRRRKQV